MKKMSLEKIKDQPVIMTGNFKSFNVFKDEMETYPAWKLLDVETVNGFTYAEVYDKDSFAKGVMGIEEECVEEVRELLKKLENL